MKLYCIRHGEAHSSAVDPECSLTEKGLRDINKIGKVLSGYSLELGDILHSPKKRAVQTAAILSSSIGYQQPLVESSLLTPESDAVAMFDMINAWNKNTLLVSHLPFIGTLVSMLVCGPDPVVNFTPGTIVCLHRYERERWLLDWVLNPGLLMNE